ncbi:hypothetical protein FKM82_014034 [Ascaphus truei]
MLFVFSLSLFLLHNDQIQHRRLPGIQQCLHQSCVTPVFATRHRGAGHQGLMVFSSPTPTPLLPMLPLMESNHSHWDHSGS